MGLGDDVKDQFSFLGGFKLTFQHLTRPRVTTAPRLSPFTAPRGGAS